MKALVCEMCGSNDLVKQDGVFVCQSCGCKYSVEEAKKMMVEGTVKVDNSDQIANYISLARSSLNSRELKNCLKYCNKALEYDAKNHEALIIKARYYEDCGGFKGGTETLKSISNSKVIDDEKVELLFEYIKEISKKSEDGLESDNFVKFYCWNEIIQVKKKNNAIKLYRHLIRSYIKELLDEHKGKVVAQIIKDFDNVTSDVIGTTKYEDDEEIDVELEIKILAKKIAELKEDYKYTDDEILLYENEVKYTVSYVIGVGFVKEFENNEIDEYHLKNYLKAVNELKEALRKIKVADPTHTFAKSIQDKIDRILKTTNEADEKMNKIETIRKKKSSADTLLFLGALIAFIAAIVVLFSGSLAGAGICILVFGVLMTLQSFVEK